MANNFCAKFGKDNNQCETIAGSSFKFLSNKEEDIYTFEDGKPIGKDNSGMVLDFLNDDDFFETLKLYFPHGYTDEDRTQCAIRLVERAKLKLSKFSQQPTTVKRMERE